MWDRDFQGKMAFGALGPVSVSAARRRLKAGAAEAPQGRRGQVFTFHTCSCFWCTYWERDCRARRSFADTDAPVAPESSAPVLKKYNM